MIFTTVRRAVLLSVLATMIYAPIQAEDGGRLLNYNPQKLHPDGLIGKFSVNGNIAYSSVTKEPGALLTDIQYLGVGLSVPIAQSFSLGGQLTGITEDSTRYCFRVYAKIYLKNPQTPDATVNADGVIGLPVLKIGFLSDYSGANEDKYRSGYLAGLFWPVHQNATGSIELCHYENQYLKKINDYTISLTLYTGKYSPNLRYLNPDGPPGNPVFRLFGGFNEDSNRGGLELTMPFSEFLSLSASASIEKFDFQDQTNYTGRLGFAYHFKS